MIDKSNCVHLLFNGSLKLMVLGVLQHDAREEIVNERQEEWLVLVDQLRKVHVSKYAHDNRLFCVTMTVTLHCTQRSQHGQDVSQTEVIVDLCRNP